MTPEELKGFLKKVQEPRGFFFNKDDGLVMELLQGLLDNKERYGYMCCPCRLASGDRSRDKDIICPCEYRDADVAEFGSCYCALYVSEAWNASEQEPEYVPERRPVEKMF